MTVPNGSRYLLAAMVLIALVAAAPGILHADPFNLSANWNYSENGGESVEEQWKLNQSYSLGFNKSLTALTNLTSSVRYTKSTGVLDSDSTVISPSLSLTTRNDLFSLNLSATQNQRYSNDNPQTTSRVWEVTGYSLLDNLPRLRLNYGQSISRDDQKVRSLDRDSQYYGMSLDYDWSAFELYYDYRHDEYKDNVVSSDTTADRHFAKLAYSESFYQGQVAVNVDQQYSITSTGTQVSVASGERVFVPIPLNRTLSALDDSPLSPNAVMNDGDKATPSNVEIAQSTILQNLGMQTDFQLIDHLRVFFDRKISLAVQSMLSWSLYTSNNNLNWTLINNQVPVTYREENGLTHIIVDLSGSNLTGRYVKLVVDSTGLSPEPVFVTELQAGNDLFATDDKIVTSSEFVTYQTNASISYRPLTSLSLAYNLTQITNQPDQGLKSTRLNQSVSANYTPSPDITVYAAIAENRGETETLAENFNRSFSLSANKQLLKSTNLSLGYTHSESYEDSSQTSEVDSVRSFLNAQIFPDLSSSFSLSWSRSRNPEFDTSSDAYGLYLNSTARLTPRVDASAFYNYSNNKSVRSELDDLSYASNRYGANCNLRPSEILSFYLSLFRDQEQQQSSFNGSASLQVSPKIQTSISTTQLLEGGELKIYNGTLSWVVSHHLSMRSSYGYRTAEGDDSWVWQLSMNATF